MKHRFEVRRSQLTPVVVANDDWLWPDTLVATEVSPRGMFLGGEKLLLPDDSVRVSFRLGTPDFWEFEGRVAHGRVWRRLGDPGHTGMGVEFVDCSPIERIKMRSLLRNIPPPLPLPIRRPLTPEALLGRRGALRGGGRRGSDPHHKRARWSTPWLTSVPCPT